MNMENVFVLYYDSAYDEETTFNVRVFKSIKTARDELKKIVEEFKENDDLYQSSSCVIETDTEDEFTAYEDGEYCLNHLSAYIKAQPIM